MIVAQKLHTVSYPSVSAQSVSRTHPTKLPLVFEPNRGQTDPEVKFAARGSGYALLLTEREAVMRFSEGEAVRIRLAGAKPPSGIEVSEPTGGISNYFYGNDPAKWHTSVPHYARVRYRDVYPGIDQVFYNDAGRLEFDVVVAPGADASQIGIEYDGAKSARIDEKGNLVLATEGGAILMHNPGVYQIGKDGHRISIDASFRLTGLGRATFLLSRYDTQQSLVIDPAIEYSTYLGGNSNEQGNGIALDSSGNAYVAGLTRSSDFPTRNPISSHGYGGGISDAFVTKINAAGTALIYSTYIGGTNTDQANAIAVDSAGNAYITGSTLSTDFPVLAPLQLTRNSAAGNAFVVKLGPNGLLIYSTYLGGSGRMGDSGVGIGTDAAGNAYVGGTTTSSDFPTKNPIQTFTGNPQNVFVSKLSSDGSALLYSTFLGGGQTTAAGLVTDSSGNAYVLAESSSDFPVTKSITPQVPGEAVVAKINPTGSALVYATAAGHGTPAGIAVDSAGNAYVTGNTAYSNYPTVNGLYPKLPGAGSQGFISKINSTGTAFVYSTFFPGCTLSAITADGAGNAYLTGNTTYIIAPNFPIKNAFQPNLVQDTDAILTALNPDGSAVVYSSLLGGQANGLAIAADAAGDAYVTGFGLNMPSDSSAFQPTSKTYPDAFIFAYASGAGPSVAVANAASFAGNSPVATNSIASAFGTRLATQTASATGTLGTTLGGTTVNVTDSTSKTTGAQIFFASPGQVNFLIPQAMASGLGQIEITAGDGTISVGPLQIGTIAPGIFTADGKLAVGSALLIDGQGKQTTLSLAQYDTASAQFKPTPIPIAASSTTLTLYGTGARNALNSQFSISIGGITIAPAYVGMQGTFVGLDQINITVPPSLAGAGDVAVVLTAAGMASNTVHVTIQ